jgi:hypothetical protein
VRGPSPVFAIVVSFQVPSLAIPAIRVVRKEEDRRSYSLPSASGDHVPAHRSPAPFQCRGCELLSVLWTSGSLHQTASTSDILVVTRGHARPASDADRCAVRHTALATFRMPVPCNCDSPSSRRTSRRHAREGKTGESPRTPSVVSRPCEPKPANRTSAYSFRVNAISRTVSPSLGSCPASGGAFELPSG